ncbi:spondin domain-containing protein [Mariniblastus fucicola]|uniref:Spondin_N n=1 Tax=Mariniblastus fucicola TaxID=980251 RepID=A0A5B9PD39_9BACT|nr:spondin domain-containing protein [Mariniblastus fucicola]QEG24288.1 Spondin_N [Mariniblastus fucicola]
MKKSIIGICVIMLATVVAAPTQAQTQRVRVEVSSNAPTGGVAITPLWVGFHDGSFDVFDAGSTASAGLEEIAETGSAAGLAADFGMTAGGVGGSLGSPTGPPPIQPGETVSGIFDLDSTDNQFFSYAAMVLPSSDFFVANGDPTSIDLASIFGTSGSISFDIGTTVWDAGTEVNDFATAPGNPLFGIPEGDGAAGAAEGGLIAEVTGDPYSGFLNTPAGFDFGPLSFNDGALYSGGIATVTITAVPEPGSFGVLAMGLGGLFLRRRR